MSIKEQKYCHELREFKPIIRFRVACTVNAIIFAGLIFRVLQHQNLFAGC